MTIRNPCHRLGIPPAIGQLTLGLRSALQRHGRNEGGAPFVSEQAPHHLSAALQRDLADRCYGWLEGMADGCVVLDQVRAVRYSNPAFAAIWGRSVAELLGEALTE